MEDPEKKRGIPKTEGGEPYSFDHQGRARAQGPTAQQAHRRTYQVIRAMEV